MKNPTLFKPACIPLGDYRFIFSTEITLRDLYAGLAMQALVSRGGWSEASGARESWRLADVMLKARETN